MVLNDRRQNVTISQWTREVGSFVCLSLKGASYFLIQAAVFFAIASTQYQITPLFLMTRLAAPPYLQSPHHSQQTVSPTCQVHSRNEEPYPLPLGPGWGTVSCQAGWSPLRCHTGHIRQLALQQGKAQEYMFCPAAEAANKEHVRLYLQDFHQ